MDNLKVSVIMPFYNSCSYLTCAVKSVLGQSYSDLELLLIDDCSTDGSSSVAIKFAEQDSRVLYHRMQSNGGPAAARNKGTELATGRFIAFLDSDDMWISEKLEKQIPLMISGRTHLTYSSYYVIDHGGAVIAKFAAPSSLTYDKLLQSNSIGNLTGIYDSNFFGKRYFQNCKHEDYAFWLGLLKEVRSVFGHGEHLAFYRKTSDSLSSNKLKVILWQWKIYTRVEKLSSVKALFLMMCYATAALRKYKRVCRDLTPKKGST